jgi:hypothetical protein
LIRHRWGEIDLLSVGEFDCDIGLVWMGIEAVGGQEEDQVVYGDAHILVTGYEEPEVVLPAHHRYIACQIQQEGNAQV